MPNQGQASIPTRGGRFGGRLPVEIGFLARHGWSAETLLWAAEIAKLSGVSADEAAIKHGLVSEAEFYRAIAAELGVPYDPAPRLSGQARFPESLLAGIAPLESKPGGLVLAPQGRQLVSLLQMEQLPGSRIAVTSPAALRRSVFTVHARLIARRASLELPSRNPGLSSRLGMTEVQLAALSSAATALALLLPAFPEATLGVITAGLTPLFFGMVMVRLAAALVPPPTSSRRPLARMPDALLPVYTVIVPLHRERRIARHLVGALSRLDYPAAKLDIKLVIEEDDQDTMAALSRVALPPFIELLVAPRGQPRTKPRALNVALPLARGQYTVIYDAEDVPEPDQLRLAVAHFARQPPEVACLQAHLAIDNAADTWLTRLFAIEYASLFDVINPGLAALQSPIPLGGTSNHFRTAVLRKVCGWDAWNVTEDADLGIRLARFGYRTADLPSSTLEEAPLTMGAWIRQRARWMKGFMQTCLTHSRQPLLAFRELGPLRFCSAVTLTLGTVVSALVYPVFTALFILTLTGQPDAEPDGLASLSRLSSWLLFGFGLAAIYVPALIGLRRRELWGLLPWLPLLPLYYGLVSAAAWRGLWELLWHPFRWNKTDHGLALTSRSSRVRSSSGCPAQPPPVGG